MLEKVDRYLQLVRELDLKLVKAVDTHLHADHITGLGALPDRTHSITVVGEQTHADVVSMRVAEGDRIEIEGLRPRCAVHARTYRRFLFLSAGRPFPICWPTVSSPVTRCSSAAPAVPISRTAIRVRNTLIYPAHDYKGDTVSTIGKEKQFNPRLKVKSIDEYVELMSNLNLPNPKMMDVAVPANMLVGMHQDEIARRGWALTASETRALRGRPDIAIVDLREKSERDKHGVIPGSLHAPYPSLKEEMGTGMLYELAFASGTRIVFYCAFGERSAMAVQAGQDAGLKTACHIAGGIDAWKKAGEPLIH